jgi:hypothetical protein
LIYPIEGFCCRPKPLLLETEDFSQIIYGTVVSIELLPYEKITLDNGDVEEIIPADYTRNHLLTTNAKKVVKGKAAFEMKLVAGGCAVVLPEIGQSGYFLISPANNRAIPIYESQHELFSKWKEFLEH